MGLGKGARGRAELAGWGTPLRGASRTRLSQRSNSKVKIPARGQEKSLGQRRGHKSSESQYLGLSNGNGARSKNGFWHASHDDRVFLYSWPYFPPSHDGGLQRRNAKDMDWWGERRGEKGGQKT